MAISPAFTVAQTGTAPNLVLITDTSTGSDGDITQRRVFVQTATGTYLVSTGTTTDYTQWSYSDASISLDILSTDQAVSITVQWLDVSNAVLYTLTQLYCLAEYNKTFFYYLIQQQALTPSIIQDANYFSNMATLWMNITGAIQAVEIGADISASQNCLDRATYMQNNQQDFF